MTQLSAKLLPIQITLLLVVGVLINVSCQITGKDVSTSKTLSEYLLDIKNEFAPDRRVAIWDVSYRGEDPVILLGETNIPAAKTSLLRKLKNAQINFLDSLQVLSPRSALVNISVCNIRSQPKHSAELSTQSIMGTPLNVYKSQGSWYYVQTPEGYLGWLDNGGLVLLQHSVMKLWQEADKLVVNVPFATVRSARSEMVVSDVTEGNILKRTGQQGDFFKVALPDGRSGLIERAKVRDYAQFLIPPASLHDHIVSTAMDFIGRPYLWGGTSGKAMDCSGFTKTVYYLNGLMLPRDASQQVHVGEEVKTDSTLKNLEPGDFLFFGRKATSGAKEKITHVAIYLGDGKMIHSSERVRIQSLRRGDDDFAENRLNTLVRAKRLLQNIGENGVEKLVDHHHYAPK